MSRLIDANAVPWEECYVPDGDTQWEYKKELCVCKPVIDQMPTVDAVEISVVELWLREIARNSMNNPINDQIPLVCAMLIERLDGLREFARERKDNETV